MKRRGNQYKRKKHLFDTQPEYVIKYMELKKAEVYWRNNGQYFMAKECERRAKCLEAENIGGYESYRKTEELYCDTRKSDLYTYKGIVEQKETSTMRVYNNSGRYNKQQNNMRSHNNRRNLGEDSLRSESKNWRE